MFPARKPCQSLAKTPDAAEQLSWWTRVVARKSCILDVVLDISPSAEIIEPLHSRAHVARAVLKIFHERLDDPPTITELCLAVGSKERALHLSCVEAFGRPPAALLAELRLNATHQRFVASSGIDQCQCSCRALRLRSFRPVLGDLSAPVRRASIRDLIQDARRLTTSANGMDRLLPLRG